MVVAKETEHRVEDVRLPVIYEPSHLEFTSDEDVMHLVRNRKLVRLIAAVATTMLAVSLG